MTLADEQPDRSARRVRGRLPSWPWAASLGLHAAVAIGAFFVVWRVAPSDEPARPVYVTFDDPALAMREAADEQIPKPERSLEHEAGGPAAPTTIALADLAPSGDARAPGLGARVELAPASPPSAAPPMTIDAAPRPVVSFGGLSVNNARDIVYVVDASGSMVTTWPETRAELLRSIEALRPTQRFQVLLVRNREGETHLCAPIPPSVRKPVLVDATRSAKQALAEWLGTITPGGTSDPRPALERALGLRPDAVFLLASRITGPEVVDFNPAALYARLDQLNPVDPRSGRRRVAIKAVQILESDPQNVLSTIGRTHGGEDGYRFIGRDELNLRGSPGLLRSTR